LNVLEAWVAGLVILPALLSAGYPIHAWLARRRSRAAVRPAARPALSVLVPVAGREPGLAAHLRIAATQRWNGPFEVVVAGSPGDPILARARAVARRHPARVRVVAAERVPGEPGKVQLLAAAATEARGEWLVLLDSDARLPGPDDLEGFAGALADPAVGLVTRIPACRRAAGWGLLLAHLIHTDLAGLFATQAAWDRLGLANGSCLAIRRATLERCGGWEPLRGRMLMDTLLARRVRAAGFRVALWPRAVEIASTGVRLRELLEQSQRWHAALARGLGPVAYGGFAWLRSGALLAAGLALAAPTPEVRVLGAVALAVRLAAAIVLERMMVRSRRLPQMLATLPLAELAAGLLWLPALFDPRIRWRGHAYRLEKGARARAEPSPAPRRLLRVIRGLRVRDWLVHLPLIAGLAAVYWSAHPEDARGFWANVALVLAIQTPLVAAGYWVNDLADARADREKDGPPRRTRVERRILGAGAALAVAAGLVLASALPPAKTLLVWIVVAAGMAYSLPGPRLKERGVLGVAAAAALQRLPAFVLILDWPPREPVLAIALGAWLFLLGLRFILEHQIADVDADLRAGVRTWTTRHGRGRAAALRDQVTGVLLATSLAAAALLLAPPVSPAGPAGAAGLALLTGLSLWLIGRQWSGTRSLPRRPVLGPGASTVRVYGAGLSGLVAAIKMAEWGRRVELCEQRLVPGGLAQEIPFVHGTRQDPETLERWLDLPLAEAFEPVEREVSYVNGWRVPGRACHWNCLRGSMPGALDRLLIERAVATGVTFRFGAPFRHPESRGRETAVLATGHSRIAFEAVGLPWERLEARFAAKPWDGETMLVSIRSGEMRNGYGYAAAGHGVVFAMVCGRGALAPGAFEHFRDELERREGLDFDDWRRLSGATSLEPCFERDGFRLAGAASGMIDPFYLSGVGAALVSGGLAALAEVDAIEAHRRFARLTWRFGPKLALARWVWPRPSSRAALLTASVLEDSVGALGAISHAPER